MYGYVYKTTCLVNNLIYVGKHKADTFEPEKYIGSGAELKKLIRLFGKENFICEMLAEASTENELRSLEEDWIIKLNATNPMIGINILKTSTFGSEGLVKIKKDNNCRYCRKEDLSVFLALGWVRLNKTQWYIENKDLKKEEWAQKNAKWYTNNKEHCLEIEKKYREANKQKIKILNKKYYIERKEQLKAYSIEYSKNNKEKRKASNRSSYLKNKTHYDKVRHEYYLAHKEQYREATRKYRAKKEKHSEK